MDTDKKQKTEDILEDPSGWGNFLTFQEWYNWIPKDGHWSIVEDEITFPFSKKITITYRKTVFDVKITILKTIEILGTSLFNSSSRRIIEYGM